ncbi:phospholipase D-like domain-containing protein [Kordiimonas aestuarii]|uniref:phospholipase D-like domain-containing protein n=1 Tax=Kordiimonas aestuarii TaxID=1005925 RepID=UPI0021D1D7B7|nr:phosphatidylserine/phosphatidylglycerophosphate/cardiolipin synthase family protein [Kordiimonas aestuarii]
MNASHSIEAASSTNRPYRFHHTVTGAWEAMLEACKGAEKSINLEEYILLPGEIGDRFTEVLKERAKAGVKVRVLLDWWGCSDFYYSSAPQELTAAGAEVGFYRAPTLKSAAPLKFFPRNHRKVLIVDDHKTFAGGVCILDKIHNWRDSMVEFDGEVTDQFLTLFNTTWNFVKDGTPIAENGVDFSGDKPYAVIANAPHTSNADFTKVFREELEKAHRCVRLSTPYFAPVSDVLEPLFNLLGRGVELELILSDYSKYAPYVVGKKLCGPLIERGAKVYYYEPSMLHLKQVIVDDSWCAIGSFNLDGLSMKQNEEVMITTGDSNFIAELQEQFEQDRTRSRPFTTDDWHGRPLSEKITGTLLRPFRRYM